MVTNTRLSLRLDPKTINELKQKALYEGKSIARFIVDAKNYFDFELNENITLRVDYIKPIEQGSEVYRVDIFFMQTGSERLLRGLWYELWVEQICVEDELHFVHGSHDKGFAEFAFRFILERYKTNNRILPSEYGAFVLPNRTNKLAINREELWQWYDEVAHPTKRK